MARHGIPAPRIALGRPDARARTHARTAGTIKYLVLDEADRLLNMDFEKEITQVGAHTHTRTPTRTRTHTHAHACTRSGPIAAPLAAKLARIYSPHQRS